MAMAQGVRRSGIRRIVGRPLPLFLGMAALSLAGCGGGGARPSPTPAPPPAPAPTPVPTPTPTPTPTPPSGNFNTAETRRSDGVNFHGAITAYQAGATGQGILAGVIDDGIDEDSPEFTGRISSMSADVAGSRGINAEGTHGTNVAQVLLGGKNDAGTFGIAFNANLLVLRADRPGSCATEDPSNDESGCLFGDNAIAAGLDRAVAADARVVNISLGGEDRPGATLRAAVARATAAGIVVILSAGNEGDTTANGNDPNNPDPFAQGMRDAGGGLVIIAGSVDENGAISGFSNRAGGYQGSYIAALGEGVCCSYENGVLKTEGNFVFVLNGTSFAAPQVAGAVALLAQAFPNLTGQQIVQLLYQSARDAGAAGDDAIYGQGILDIARAFQPQGATTLAGTSTAVRLDTALGLLGGPMGDAGAKGAGETRGLVTDSFGRAFTVDFGQSLRPRRPDFKLSGALGGLVRQQSAASQSTAMSLLTAPGIGDGDALAGLSFHDAERARTLAASVITRLDANTRLGFSAGRGIGGMLAGERGESGHAMLIGDGAQEGLGFAASPGLGSLARHNISKNQYINIFAESGWVSGSRWDDDPLLRYRSGHDSRYDRLGAAWDGRFGRFRAALGASWLRESASLLGARLGPVFGAGGATSLTGDASLSLDAGNGWNLAGAWRQMWTRPDRAGLVAGGMLRSNAFSFDVAKANLFRPGDHATLRFAQPLRVARGGIDLDLPVAYDYETGGAEFGRRTYNLAPTGREMVVEASYAFSLFGGDLVANTWWRQDPGHIAAMPDDKGAALRFTMGF
ncbi:S8 family serine peptidase [Sphingopyxis sp. BSN-002]|uniref:S8 family peptidase n=1 Tax=Sphingopyxis sp. BSN-002 TaxID=2911495 RepID=UPI001EDA1475|nr:S8 family peptidase [Sphingopyxis sp. BSN-002]UKK83011.1 S8 family serine peptidase [Sphingopyxis sp. BSN-002]